MEIVIQTASRISRVEVLRALKTNNDRIFLICQGVGSFLLLEHIGLNYVQSYGNMLEESALYYINAQTDLSLTFFDERATVITDFELKNIFENKSTFIVLYLNENSYYELVDLSKNIVQDMLTEQQYNTGFVMKMVNLDDIFENIDDILDRISKIGINNLTQYEKKYLNLLSSL